MNASPKKSSLTERLLVTVFTSLIVGGGLGYIGGKNLNNQKEQQHKERAAASDALWDESFNRNDAADPNLNTRRYIDNAQAWTYDIKDMPKIPPRTAMANSILKAVEDDVITADENKALKAQFDQLKISVVNHRTQENATKIAAGEDITDDRGKNEMIYEYLTRKQLLLDRHERLAYKRIADGRDHSQDSQASK